LFLFCVATVINSPAQKIIDFFNFNGTDGAGPVGPLVQGLDGKFYGATSGGGVGGTLFDLAITPKRVLTTLYSFCPQNNCSSGAVPEAGPVQATDGNFYGTTSAGGVFNLNGCRGDNCGTVFKITPNGTLTTLYDFCAQTNCTDGWFPQAGLVQATDGNFYGTTENGGTISSYCFQGCGTVFKVTPAGALTTLYSFCA